MKNFRTYQMAKELHREVKSLTLKGELKDQIERASLSVALNLVEGSGRIGNDRLKFFRYAFGSIKEVQGCLDIIDHPLVNKAEGLAKGIWCLLKNPGRGY